MSPDAPAPGGAPSGDGVLVVSSDAVAAALLGALLDTAGYRPLFPAAGEAPRAALRRSRPAAVLVDCADETSSAPEFLGPAIMLGIPVVLFGTEAAAARAHATAEAHELPTLILARDVGRLVAVLKDAVEEAPSRQASGVGRQEGGGQGNAPP